MNRSRLLTRVAVLAALSVVSLPTAVSGDELLDVYIARLCSRDHVNSNGVRLKTVAAIIRQDRANYHKFGHRDDEDQYDSVFDDQHDRGLLEQKLARGRCSASARRSILNGTPLIQVKIYRSSVDVTVLD